MATEELVVIPFTQIEQEASVAQYPWMQYPNEPDDLFDMFSNYYLPLGGGRNLLKAAISYIASKYPQQLQKYTQEAKKSADPKWSQAAKTWSWLDRAHAFDAFIYQDALMGVADAKNVILTNAKKAAETLVLALANPRLQVAAAKEILDRAGLPATTVHQISVTPYSADEYAKASEEVTTWENQMRNPEQTALNS